MALRRSSANTKIERLRQFRARAAGAASVAELIDRQIQHVRVERDADLRTRDALHAAFGPVLLASIRIIDQTRGIVRLQASHPVHRTTIERLIRSDERVKHVLRSAGIRRFRWENDRPRANPVV